jgi:hypothetical protein
MFQVIWRKHALDDLAKLWIATDAEEGRLLNAACARIDHLLERDPHNEGEGRTRGRRITFVSPLAVMFRVQADGKTVKVSRIRGFRGRKR